MKYKHIITLGIIGFVVYVLGALNKIMHTPLADILLTTSACIIILSLLLAAIKVLFTKDKNSFLNK